MDQIKSISQIDTSTTEGILLVAALAKISTESQTDKTPDEVLEQISKLVSSDETSPEFPNFEMLLTDLINKKSMENGSNTPDYILAAYVIKCMHLLDWIIGVREKWYGVHLSPLSNPMDMLRDVAEKLSWASYMTHQLLPGSNLPEKEKQSMIKKAQEYELFAKELLK
jgi:hypothetical protein